MRIMMLGVVLSAICALALNIYVVRASIAYGTLNNFDCVNDTGVVAHGFDIELDGIRSKDITYTYDYNHYGVPRITEDLTDPLHPKVLVRYASARNPDGTWAAYTAIPSGPIAPTQGHQFTNPSVNFGGEHFGVGYYGAPSAVRYYWLIDDGKGNLIHGPPVNVSTPTFVYVAPQPAIPAQVVAVVVPPLPPAPPVLQFGDASWVKDIKTTTHNASKVRLQDLVADDPGQPQPWANGEPAEVETEWRILQTEFGAANGGRNGELQGKPEDLPGGDEVITRRYEFYKYIGPVDAESGEAMADTVAPDGIHGVGIVTYNDHIDPITGEWVTVTVDLSTIEVVGDFFGAQMSGFDVAPVLGLIDHVQDGELNVPYPNRTVVVPGGAPFLASLKQPGSSLPDGLTFDPVAGVLSGTPRAAGTFTFTIEASDTTGVLVSKAYTITIPAGVPITSTIVTSASPLAGGTTSGDGIYNNGTHLTVVASHNPGYAFVNWTEGLNVVSNTAVYPFTVNANRVLTANFVQTFEVATSALPAAGGSTSGGGTYNSGDPVTVVAAANADYAFINWTEGGAAVSVLASYTFTADANRALTANFAPVPDAIKQVNQLDLLVKRLAPGPFSESTRINLLYLLGQARNALNQKDVGRACASLDTFIRQVRTAHGFSNLNFTDYYPLVFRAKEAQRILNCQ
ncbi:MAG TPA: putative Ig domain-containing protein [Blastocatellia bacterium]|nr:putative Ig domain-containing protein [Blastocatellia bacterium]